MPPWNDSIEAMLMILPRRPTDHLPRGGLGQEEGRLEIDVHHRVPVGLGEVERVGAADDAGIVDQDVEPADCVTVSATIRRTGSIEPRSAVMTSETVAQAPSTACPVSSGAVRPTATMSAPASAKRDARSPGRGRCWRR